MFWSRRKAPRRTICQCPSCGHFEPHALGDPCCQHKCPKCGTRLLGTSCWSERRQAVKK